MKKRIINLIVITIITILSIGMTVSATEVNEEIVQNNQDNAGIIFITPKEMEQIIASQKAGIETCNWFPDSVLITVTKEADGHCRFVFLNNGFPFDRCDIDGMIYLYDANMRVVGRQLVAEHKLVCGWPRIVDIYPLGNNFTSGSYSLRLSDGDAGTLYEGTF